MTTPPKKQAPGILELVSEVRELAVAVGHLHNIFVKRKVLYIVLGLETAIVAAALIVGAIFIALENSHQNDLVSKSAGSCAVRNAQIDATRTYLQRQVDISNRSQAITAAFLGQLHLHFNPAQQQEIKDLTREQQQALFDYFHSQPADVNCAKLKN